jgi:hypothetical protein
MLTNLNISGLKVEVARDTHRHVKKTLPPSLSGFPGMADIKYYVKATVVRPQFYKENIRTVRARSWMNDYEASILDRPQSQVPHGTTSSNS